MRVDESEASSRDTGFHAGFTIKLDCALDGRVFMVVAIQGNDCTLGRSFLASFDDRSVFQRVVWYDANQWCLVYALCGSLPWMLPLF